MEPGEVTKITNPADPNRCQRIIPNQGQCTNVAYKLTDDNYSKYCIAHGGSRDQDKLSRINANNYRLTKWKQRVQEKAGNPQIKSLSEEIGIVRMLLEERLNQCESSADLMLQSNALSDLALKIERLVTKTQQLDRQLGQQLGKTEILQFAHRVIEIITQADVTENQLDFISNEILKVIGELGNDD